MIINRLINEVADLSKVNLIDSKLDKAGNSLELVKIGEVISDTIEVDISINIYLPNSDAIDKMALLDKATKDGKMPTLDGYEWTPAGDDYVSKKYRLYVEKAKLIDPMAGVVQPIITTDQKIK